MTGYISSQYAMSLAEYGTPRKLSRSGGWILEREIPGFSHRDAMGCYPLFACENWHQLQPDLEEMSGDLISVALVSDPFGDYRPADLQKYFDRVVHFKEHFVVDLARPAREIVSSRHRDYSRQALREVSVERCQEPIEFLDDWMHLYNTLIERYKITGIRAFSRTVFEKQLSVPGIVVFSAKHHGIFVGAQLWYLHGTAGYSHLVAVSPDGYRLRAAYALHWTALKWFAQHLRWLDLGAGAGLSNGGSDGLAQFKRGFSSETKPVYFCGRIFDREKYAQIVTAKGSGTSGYFPAYRKGEFE